MATDIVCQIHYCKEQKLKDTADIPYGAARALQHHELILICEGYGYVMIGNERYPIKNGMLFYIPPGVQLTLEPETQKPAHFLKVHFSASRMVLSSDGTWRVQENIKTLHQPYAQEVADYTRVAELFEKLLDTWNSKGPSYEFVAGTILRQLFVQVSYNNHAQSKNHAVALKIDKTIEYMRQNISQTVTLKQLSAIAGLSPFYLSRAFKDATGYPIIAYFNKMKIDKAKELLIEGNKKVKEVAYALGYTNEFYFSRMFKRTEGLSPKEFLQQECV